MQDELFVGLDIHRKSIVATALDDKGSVVDRSTLSGRDEDLRAYLRRLPGRKHVALEACTMWEHVYDVAREEAENVVLAHPYRTRIIAEASIKTDKVDSHSLAKLLRLNALPTAYAPPREIRDLRQLVRERRRCKEVEVAVKNHVYSLLVRRGIEYPDGILNFVRKRSVLRELKMPAVDHGLDLLESVEGACKGLDKAVLESFKASPEAQLLYSIPGVGELTALILVAELCPISRFANSDKVCSYAGLVPTVHQSGETSYHGRLRQDCNHFLRTSIVESSWMHRYFDKKGDVAKLGRRVARRRGKGKGSIAGARKLLKIVYAVLKRGTPYTPERPSRETHLRGPAPPRMHEYGTSSGADTPRIFIGREP